MLWTFTIAILMLCSLEKYALKENSEKNVPLMTVIVIIAAILSFLSDGGVGGILLIASMYIFREQRVWYWIGCIIATIVMAFNFMWIQIFAIVGILLLKLYNETKGRKCKMLFYVFYPLHLLVLAGIALITVL